LAVCGGLLWELCKEFCGFNNCVVDYEKLFKILLSTTPLTI